MGRKPKLTPHQKQEILRRKENGEAVREIARSYNVCSALVSRCSRYPAPARSGSHWRSLFRTLRSCGRFLQRILTLREFGLPISCSREGCTRCLLVLHMVHRTMQPGPDGARATGLDGWGTLLGPNSFHGRQTNIGGVSPNRRKFRQPESGPAAPAARGNFPYFRSNTESWNARMSIRAGSRSSDRAPPAIENRKASAREAFVTQPIRCDGIFGG